MLLYPFLFLFQISLASSLIPAAAAAAAAVSVEGRHPSDNANECMTLLPQLSVCSKSFYPSNECCNVTVNLFLAGCFCTPMVRDLAGGFQGWMLETLLLPMCKSRLKMEGQKMECSKYQQKTYNQGTCQLTDMAIATKRIQTVQSFSNLMFSWAGSSCFNYKDFETAVSGLFNPNASATIGMGVGTYVGVVEMSEYFALMFRSVNKYIWTITPSVSHEKDLVSFSADGSVVTLEMTLTFNGCESTIEALQCNDYSKLYDDQPTALGVISTFLLKTANQSFSEGISDICRYHTKYCTGALEEFESENKCLEFMSSLPLYSPVCGLGSFAIGDALTCRWKHHLMVAIDPVMHCPHLRRNSEKCTNTNCEEATHSDPNLVEDMLEKYGKEFDQAIAIDNVNFLEPQYPVICRKPTIFMIFFQYFTLIMLVFIILFLSYQGVKNRFSSSTDGENAGMAQEGDVQDEEEIPLLVQEGEELLQSQDQENDTTQSLPLLQVTVSPAYGPGLVAA